ncbi:LamG domain-containing protein [Cerasicoccus arenae]|uniref:Laminin G domain-containing protein n=1 Tax=Cerasicoccus arenae TaxID=424488 RepID=A0A8J3GE58_9BACT|nr:LamG domain-containing protein [Cerasicoccus arenae]MBK1858090.1 LamG domain-containing protein [Cerasicoccus arenae]GHC07024.1 hypothetical protein GCM10007047_25130 [Cerasicoccus arenae]
MSTFPRARIRIAADMFQFENFADELRSGLSGFIPKLRAGDDAQFEIALFNDGELLTDLSGISSLHLEIKPLHAEAEPAFIDDDGEDYDLRGPSSQAVSIRSKTIAASEMNAALTLTQWESLSADQAHAIVTLDAPQTNLAPGDRWLTIAVTTNDSPAQTRTVAAGRIRILGGGRSSSEPVSSSSETFYSASQSDSRFLRLSENLADLSDAEESRGNLGLGSAAQMNAIDEDDFASQSNLHLPTQQSVKTYVDTALAAFSPTIPRPGVLLDGISGKINLGNAFNQDMTADWAVCGWFRTDLGAEQTLLHKGESTPHLQISLTSSGLLRVTLDDGSDSVSVDTTAVVNDGQWHHFVVSIDVDSAIGVAVYMDGQLQATGDPTALGDLSNEDPLYIGSSGSSLYFSGSLSGFGFLSQSLSSDEVAQLREHDLSSWIAVNDTSDLEIALPLDEGVGYQVHDLSGHQHDGLASTTGVKHLAPKSEGYLRAYDVDAYNGGTGNVELISSTQDILPTDKALITRLLVFGNNGGSTVSDIDILRSNRSTTSPLLDTTASIIHGGTVGIAVAVLGNVAQGLFRNNVVIHSTDPQATSLDIRIDYTCLQGGAL